MRDWLKCGRAARESTPDRLRRFSLVALGRSLVLLGLALFLQALRSSLLAAPSALVLVGHGASSAACPARRLRFIVSHPYEYSRLDRETVEIGARLRLTVRAGRRSGRSVEAIRCDTLRSGLGSSCRTTGRLGTTNVVLGQRWGCRRRHSADSSLRTFNREARMMVTRRHRNVWDRQRWEEPDESDAESGATETIDGRSMR